MGSKGRGLCAVLCFWGMVSGSTLQTVGPCTTTTGTTSFDCSRRKLSHIPTRIWDNVTVLDLSENLLNPQHLNHLQRFDHLVTLNLSGNYLPLLEKDHLGNLPSLQMLDLSRCQLTSIEAGALEGLPRLQRLFLGANRLEVPLPVSIQDLGITFYLDGQEKQRLDPGSDDWPTGTDRELFQGSRVIITQDDHSKGVQSDRIQRRIHRKLLTDDLDVPSSTQSTTMGLESTTPLNGTDGGRGVPSHNWKYLMAVLVTAISVSLLIAMLAKCQVVRSYLASYRHTRLREGDTVSQCDSTLEVGFSMHGGGHGRNLHTVAVPQGEIMAEDDEDDDDGFIEDNYIQASERERAERAAEKLQEEEEDEDEEEEGDEDEIDIEFTIG